MASAAYWEMVAGTEFHNVDLADTRKPSGPDVICCYQFKDAMIAHFDSKEGALAKKMADGLRSGACVPVRPAASSGAGKIWKPGELFFKS